MFLEYSGNITSGLLKFAKDQHLLLSNHTLLTQTQHFPRELFKKHFSSKYSLNVTCPNVTLQHWGNTQLIFPEYYMPAGKRPTFLLFTPALCKASYICNFE